MKRILCMVVMLLLVAASACAATKTVNLPDQHITVRVYGSAAVERTPNTIIRSFTSDQKIAYSGETGVVSGDMAGSTTSVLKEYDEANDILYVTKVKVTVLPRDPDMDYERDQSANSTAVQQYTHMNGKIFPVGMQWSFAMKFTKNGQSLPVTYTSSNPEVATIDSKGMVTMRAAGTTTLAGYCKELQTGQTVFVTVYGENTGGSMHGFLSPEDPGTITKVYAQPDKNSKVLYTLHSTMYYGNHVVIDGVEIDVNMHTIEKGAEWCKVTSQLGTGYIPTANMSFSRDKTYNPPTLETGSTLENQSDEDFRTYTVGGIVYGTDSECYLYPKADKASKKLLTVPVNGKMTVLGETGSYLKVKYDGKTGYVTLHSVSPTPVAEEKPRQLSLPATMYTIRGIPLFEGPRTNSRIADYPKDTAVWAIEKYNETWIQVEVDGRKGYMNLDYLTAIKPDQAADYFPATTMVVQTGNDGKLYLRQKPNGTVIGKYANGTQVKVTQVSGDWATVQVGGTKGYMMIKFLQPLNAQTTQTPATEQGAPVTTKIIQTGNAEKLNLRREPKAGAMVIERYPNGTQVEVLNALDDTWDQVRVGGRTGYMMDRFLTTGAASTPAQPEAEPQPEAAPQPEAEPQPEAPTVSAGGTMYIHTANGGTLCLRSQKSTKSLVIQRYANGTQVTVLEVSGIWAKVKVDGRQGFMMREHLSATKPATAQPSAPATQQPSGSITVRGTKVVQTGNPEKLNLRNYPRSNAMVLNRYPNGTQVEILDPLNSTWDKVRVNGQTGYMMDQYLQ